MRRDELNKLQQIKNDLNTNKDVNIAIHHAFSIVENRKLLLDCCNKHNIYALSQTLSRFEPSSYDKTLNEATTVPWSHKLTDDSNTWYGCEIIPGHENASTDEERGVYAFKDAINEYIVTCIINENLTIETNK